MDALPRLDTYHLYEYSASTYDGLCEAFDWEVPDYFNLPDYTCDKWADDADRTALYYDDGTVTAEYSFGDIISQSDKFAEFLQANQISRGDRVGICLSQRPETPICHLGAWKAGAVTVPMSILAGAETIEYKVEDASIDLIVSEDMALDSVEETASHSDSLDKIVPVGTESATTAEPFDRILSLYEGSYDRPQLRADDDVIINYTSGTTGQPKGVRHAHRHVLGIIPEFLMGRNMEVSDSDVYRTAVDWSWAGSLNYVVMPSWFFGVPLVATGSGKFDEHREFELIDRYGISVYDVPATALRRMMSVDNPADSYDLSALRVISSGGEAVGDAIIDWIESALGAVPREGYGQTEALAFIGDCPKLGIPHKEGKMGVRVPGHTIRIVEPTDPQVDVEVGEVGELTLECRGNPLCFKEYLNKPRKTAQAKRDGWLLTGDLVREHDDGYIEFIGRKDGVIISSGYRIGPEEIEDCISELSAVTDAAVIGVPDEDLGEVPKAFVVLDDEFSPSEELKDEITEHTREQLAQYKYPRIIEFIDDLPTTTTGKIARNELKEM